MSIDFLKEMAPVLLAFVVFFRTMQVTRQHVRWTPIKSRALTWAMGLNATAALTFTVCQLAYYDQVILQGLLETAPIINEFWLIHNCVTMAGCLALTEYVKERETRIAGIRKRRDD